MKRNPVEVLRRVHAACNYLNPETKGGAHTDVLVIDPQRLTIELAEMAGLPQNSRARKAVAEASERLAERFLVKKGKTRDFVMQLVGNKENIIPRQHISHAFGPFGYNLFPSVEKVLTDASESAREVPYLAGGKLDSVLAPDIITQLCTILETGTLPKDFLTTRADETPFLTFFDEAGDDHEYMSIYNILGNDIWFKGSCENFESLVAFQRFVRNNPLTREMEESLAQFFDAPITVGVRDTVRWLMGSRHPEIGWEKARQTILACFEKYRAENFVPVEVTYYAPDTDTPHDQVQGAIALNARVLPLFVDLLAGCISRTRLKSLDQPTLMKIGREVLEFHHDYPIYQLEPYQGVLSVSTAKLGLRLLMNLSLLAAKVDLKDRPNTDLSYLRKRPGALGKVLLGLDEVQRKALMHAIGDALSRYSLRNGLPDATGNVLRWQRITKTFFSFQEKAHFQASQNGTVEKIISLQDLQKEEHLHYLDDVPELSEKLAMFFVLVYRYYKDTGFIPDLRPKNAGRDIFLLGIWGYVSDNLLLIFHRDQAGEQHVSLSFVDNKDQFKEYRRAEDRRAPVGLAKNAVRLVAPVVEPAMLRAVGIFTEKAYHFISGTRQEHTPIVRKLAENGIDIAHEVVHSWVNDAFTAGKSTAEDVVDDIFTGLRSATKITKE